MALNSRAALRRYRSHGFRADDLLRDVLCLSFKGIAGCADANLGRSHRGQHRNSAERVPLRRLVSPAWLGLGDFGCRANFGGPLRIGRDLRIKREWRGRGSRDSRSLAKRYADISHLFGASDSGATPCQC